MSIDLLFNNMLKHVNVINKYYLYLSITSQYLAYLCCHEGNMSLQEERGWISSSFESLSIVDNVGLFKPLSSELTYTLEAATESCPLVHFLECDEVFINGVRFLGATLWTDYASTRLSEQAENMRVLGSILSVHKVISMDDRRFSPSDALRLHKASKAWLAEKLDTPHEGKTVVVTHHGPSIKCAHPYFGNNQTASGFISNLDHLVKKANVWCSGHTHSSLNRKLGNCRLLSNQKGYPRELVTGGFQADLVIEV